MSQHLNLVFVCREYGPVTGGGIGTYIYNVCQTMTDKGHRVTLITDCFENLDDALKPARIRIIAPHQTRPLRSGRFVSANHEYTYRILDTLSSLCQKEDVDVAEFAEFGGEGFATIRAKRLLNRFANTKLIIKLHTPQSLLYVINEDRQLDAGKLCDVEMEDYCVRHADLVTSPSQSLAEYFKARLKRQDIRRCPYPINLPQIETQQKLSETSVKTIRFVGSIQVRKGVDVFIEAAQKILAVDNQFRFEIYGAVYNAKYFGQSYDDILKRQIAPAHQAQIQFMGQRSYEEILDIFTSACFCVFPSRWENWANVCLEAMSLRCVVIASNQGGMAEMIDDGVDGFLIDPHSADQIASLILRNSAQIDRLRRISQKAQEKAVRLSDPEKTANRIEDNYKTALPHRQWQSISLIHPLPKVSIVIPYYNQPQFISEAVTSVRRSGYANVEIVVVNDGSDTPEAIKAFDEISGVIKVSKPNGGLSSARNAGIKRAGGEYILPLDADDKIHPDYIDKAVEALENNPGLAYVSCHTQNFGAFEDAYIPLGYVSPLMPFINTDGKCTNLFRRNVFDIAGGYDEVMTSYEDWEFLISLHDNKLEGDVLPSEYFYYRRHYDSMVYQVANPLRAELVQYMMIKHAHAWKEDAPTMAIVLARLWKDQEILHEVAQTQCMSAIERPVTSFQVYWDDGSGYRESNSVKAFYPHHLWLDLSVMLESGTGKGHFRIDPADKTGTVRIRKLTLNDASTGKPFWQMDAKTCSDALAPLENVAIEKGSKDMIFHGADNDPQILVKGIPHYPKPVCLRATLFFSHLDDARIVGYAPHQNQIKKLVSTLGILKP